MSSHLYSTDVLKLPKAPNYFYTKQSQPGFCAFHQKILRHNLNSLFAKSKRNIFSPFLCPNSYLLTAFIPYHHVRDFLHAKVLSQVQHNKKVACTSDKLKINCSSDIPSEHQVPFSSILDNKEGTEEAGAPKLYVSAKWKCCLTNIKLIIFQIETKNQDLRDLHCTCKFGVGKKVSTIIL